EDRRKTPLSGTWLSVSCLSVLVVVRWSSAQEPTHSTGRGIRGGRTAEGQRMCSRMTAFAGGAARGGTSDEAPRSADCRDRLSTRHASVTESLLRRELWEMSTP